jgi:hypothetical protein
MKITVFGFFDCPAAGIDPFLPELPCKRRQNVMAIKADRRAARRYWSKTTKTGISVMLSFTRVLDRVRPQASLAIALAADEIRAGHQLPDRKSADHTAWWHAIADEVIEWVRQPQAGAIQPV